MNPDEWESLKALIEDSFWVMRVIGPCRVAACRTSGVRGKKADWFIVTINGNGKKRVSAFAGWSGGDQLWCS
jgi:hypothetical protein